MLLDVLIIFIVSSLRPPRKQREWFWLACPISTPIISQRLKSIRCLFYLIFILCRHSFWSPKYTRYIKDIHNFINFQAQRYEAASTIFGPHTLDIYLNKYVELTEAVLSVSNLTKSQSRSIELNSCRLHYNFSPKQNVKTLCIEKVSIIDWLKITCFFTFSLFSRIQPQILGQNHQISVTDSSR